MYDHRPETLSHHYALCAPPASRHAPRTYLAHGQPLHLACLREAKRRRRAHQLRATRTLAATTTLGILSGIVRKCAGRVEGVARHSLAGAVDSLGRQAPRHTPPQRRRPDGCTSALGHAPCQSPPAVGALWAHPGDPAATRRGGANAEQQDACTGRAFRRLWRATLALPGALAATQRRTVDSTRFSRRLSNRVGAERSCGDSEAVALARDARVPSPFYLAPRRWPRAP